MGQSCAFERAREGGLIVSRKRVRSKGREWVEMRGDVVGEGNSGERELNVAGETLDRFCDCLLVISLWVMVKLPANVVRSSTLAR
jgi:hypothetical protein